MPNWADTRYVDWTSWKAAANHWPNASGGTSTQAESSGLSVFAHEFSHLRGLPDNYNNPFADNERNFTGYWEMMSRGTFNGPGGTHNRWQVPNEGGSGLGPHHLLHFKNQLGVLAPNDQVTLERNTLQDQGVAVVRVQAREVSPAAASSGSRSTSAPGGDLAGTCANQGFTGPTSSTARTASAASYSAYRLEVVDRVGNDSFAPGHGVLSRRAAPRHAARLADRPAPRGHRDDRLLPAGRHARAGRPRRSAAAERRHVPCGYEHSGSEYEYKDDCQPAALLRPRQAPGRQWRALVRPRRPPLRRRRPVRARTRGRECRQDGAPPRLPRLVHVPADQYGPGGDRRVRLRHLPGRGELEQRGLEGHAAERAGRGEGRPDRPGAGARAAGPADRRRRCADRRHAEGHV